MIVFVCGGNRSCHNNSDIATLARAAVSGDETALDMFNWKKAGKGGGIMMPASLGPQEDISFFLGGQNGSYVLLS